MTDNRDLIEDILNNPSKYYSNKELEVLISNIKKKKTTGTMKNFVKQIYDEDRDYVFTDGSCVNNGKKGSYGGYGVFFGKKDLRNLSIRFDSDEVVTNNKAELTAILECLKLLHPGEKWYVVSDSEYSINCITKWYYGWRKNGWKTAKGKQVKNRDLIEDILKKLEILNIKFLHVNSHQEMPKDKKSMEYKLWYGNYMADKYSTRIISEKN